MANSEKPPLSSEVLAQINAALTAAGLDRKPDREPLPLFKQLLSDWLYSHRIDENLKEIDQIKQLLAGLDAGRIKKALNTIYTDALALSTAQGTLTIWTRRELDTEYQRLQNLVDNQRLNQQRQG